MLWCYAVDAGNWGQMLCQTANEMGVKAALFTDYDPRMRKGDYAFMRIPQWEPECTEGKELARKLFKEGLKLIPDPFTIICYEDKLIQTMAYREWIPDTYVLRKRFDSVRDAQRAARDLGFPFISKSKQASSSVNVRLIRDMDEAMAEWEQVMEGEGKLIRIGKGREGRQVDYLIWQKFCEGNAGDIRICINGEHMMMLERDNAHGSPFASGSGKNRPINDPTEFQKKALYTAKEFFQRHGYKWNGIDLVFDYDEDEWKILETTLGWSLPAYKDCRYLGTNYTGEHIWELLVTQLENGVFG